MWKDLRAHTSTWSAACLVRWLPPTAEEVPFAVGHSVTTWARAHPEEVREHRRRYYALHREELNAKARRRRAEHRDEANEKLRQYRAAHPGKHAEAERRRRARRKAGE